MINTWGLYPWFIEDGEHLIFKDDLEVFKILSPYGKVFECVDEVGEFIVLRYGQVVYKVNPVLYKQVAPPDYDIGKTVTLLKKPEIEGIIVDINWHGKEGKPMYFMSVNGKRKSSRYFSDDFN